MFGDAGLPRGVTAYVPDRLIGERHVGPSALAAAGEQIFLWLAPTPVRAQRFQQFWVQRQIAIFASFTLNDADDHALAIDVTHLKADHFGAAHPGAVS